jgi:hypothetical protein
MLAAVQGLAIEHSVFMSAWGRSVYGDPCRECGYDWSVDVGDAIGLISGAPRRYAELIAGTDGTTRGAGLDWSSGAYVCHVVDNLRIWAERLAGTGSGSSVTIAPYDAELLAQARRYESITMECALWSLGKASVEWAEAVEIARRGDSTLLHPERGELTVRDVVSTNAHDAFHHAWDISRILGRSPAP